MTDITTLPIELLRRRSDARKINDRALASLAESIEEIGLINPIRVRRVGEVYEVIAGSHRFAACDLVGLRNIPCIIVRDDDLHAELAMIDENLMRAELSASDRAATTARRKAIYLELHPETAAHVAGAHASNAAQGNATANFAAAPSFASATAAITGGTERTVRLDAERGEKVIPEALAIIRGTRLDRGVYLDRLKKLPPNEQVTAAKRDLAHEKKRASEPHGGVAGRYKPAKHEPDDQMFHGFVAMADSLVAVSIDALIASAGRQRAILGQRASGLAQRMAEIMERLD